MLFLFLLKSRAMCTPLQLFPKSSISSDLEALVPSPPAF